jgi:hypothetical protein
VILLDCEVDWKRRKGVRDSVETSTTKSLLKDSFLFLSLFCILFFISNQTLHKFNEMLTSQSGKKEESFTRMISMKNQATPSSLSWSPSILMLGFQESILSPTTPSSPPSWTLTSPRIPSKSQPAAYLEALGWEGRMPMRYSNGCCALGNQVGYYVKPPPIWWTDSPTPSRHGPPTEPSWPAT